MIGLDERQLILLLGAPAAQKDRPPGKTWRYRQGRCTVDLVLFPDVQTRIYHALSYEVINDDDTNTGQRLCLAGIKSHPHPGTPDAAPR